MQLFRFLTGPDDATFCHKITKALNEGWFLYGNPTYAYDSKTQSMRCGQAVIKQVEGKDYDPTLKFSQQ